MSRGVNFDSSVARPRRRRADAEAEARPILTDCPGEAERAGRGLRWRAVDASVASAEAPETGTAVRATGDLATCTLGEVDAARPVRGDAALLSWRCGRRARSDIAGARRAAEATGAASGSGTTQAAETPHSARATCTSGGAAAPAAAARAGAATPARPDHAARARLHVARVTDEVASQAGARRLRFRRRRACGAVRRPAPHGRVLGDADASTELQPSDAAGGASASAATTRGVRAAVAAATRARIGTGTGTEARTIRETGLIPDDVAATGARELLVRNAPARAAHATHGASTPTTARAARCALPVRAARCDHDNRDQTPPHAPHSAADPPDCASTTQRDGATLGLPPQRRRASSSSSVAISSGSTARSLARFARALT